MICNGFFTYKSIVLNQYFGFVGNSPNELSQGLLLRVLSNCEVSAQREVARHSRREALNDDTGEWRRTCAFVEDLRASHHIPLEDMYDSDEKCVFYCGHLGWETHSTTLNLKGSAYVPSVGPKDRAGGRGREPGTGGRGRIQTKRFENPAFRNQGFKTRSSKIEVPKSKFGFK